MKIAVSTIVGSAGVIQGDEAAVSMLDTEEGAVISGFIDPVSSIRIVFAPEDEKTFLTILQKREVRRQAQRLEPVH